MKGNRCYVGLLLLLGTAFQAQSATAADAEPQFTYSDEWSLVSAPPPAGPYQPVNIDPRVPGPGMVSQMPMAMPPPQAIQPPRIEGGYAAGPDGEMPGRTVVDQAAGNASEAPAIMPPVPGHYAVMPETADTGEAADEDGSLTAQQVPAAGPLQAMEPEQVAAPETADTEEAAGEDGSLTAQQVPAAEPSQAMEPEQVAAPETADTEEAAGEDGSLTAQQVPAAEPSQAMEPEQVAAPETAVTEEAAGEDGSLTAQQVPAAEPSQATEPGLGTAPVAAETEPSMADQGESGLAATTDGENTETGMTEQIPANVTETAADERSQVPLEAGLPPADQQTPGTYAVEESATEMQERPVLRLPAPGYYENMMPPAAGRIAPEPPEGPAARLREQPADQRYPAGGGGYPGYGYYSRPVPSSRNYGYPETSRYPYQSGMPGYMNTPAYGYPRGHEWPRDEYVPPPPVYDSRQYPGEKGRVPR